MHRFAVRVLLYQSRGTPTSRLRQRNDALFPLRRYCHDIGQVRLEEQTLSRFHEKRYCSIKIGQILNNRYRILAKLGYGAYSTVWLARDQRTNEYISIKVHVRDDSEASPVTNELKILAHMKAVASDNSEEAGPMLTRLHETTFEFEGHTCLVMKPQACSLQVLQDSLVDRRVPKQVMMAVVLRLLGCINWLQLECGVVHTEITPQNIMMSARDDILFRRAEAEERDDPSARSVDYTHPHPHAVYPSRGRPRSISEALGDSTLGDFGSAKLLKAGESTRGWWMPDTYRAPEVLMGVQWDHAVDIWSIGVMVLELLEGKNVFNPIDHVNSQYVLPIALAQYIGYMGSPPLWMIQQSNNPYIRSFFDEQGNWIADPPIQTTSFEDFVTVIPPGEEKTQLLNFLKKTFTWSPADREHSAGLAEDEWLTAPFKAMGVLR